MVVFHTPVLLKEAVEFLKIKKGQKYIDATIGGGGHAEAILKAGGEVLGIDWDPEAVKFAKKRLALACPPGVYKWKVVLGNFIDLKRIAGENGFAKVGGILFDLGVSSHQIETDKRGFSFRSGAPLDMRMDPTLKITAADLINVLSKKELYELFSKFSQEKLARPIAAAIVRARALRPISSGSELAKVVSSIYRRHYRVKTRIDPATKVFQALRIAVNDELNNLTKALPQATGLLGPERQLVIISFHGLEDGIVKRFFKQKEGEGVLKILTKKPIMPSKDEIRNNPRSRSAKLRAAKLTDKL